MGPHFGPIEIHCDAPPYPIVRACRRLGFAVPEDVRWCRLSRFLSEPEGLLELLPFPLWKTFFGRKGPRPRRCTCGQELPRLEKYRFTFLTGSEVEYLLGQCGRCQAIYWDEP
jgi:hypothetical protein